MGHNISGALPYMPQLEDEVEAIQFPFYRQGEVVNIKYRDFQKNFRMAGGAERVLYGLDDVQGDTLIWVEGEIDKLAVEMAGHVSCVSVPDGAPSPNTKDYQAKFDYLASAEEILGPIRQHIIAVDHDPPGEKLAEELIRRLGPERCWRVQWPSGCKDANDVLMRDGPEALAACLQNAQPCPIAGIVRVRDLSDALTMLYAEGLPSGLSPGWDALARLYTVRQGELTVVMGIPGHGKSTLLSAILTNLAMQQEWTFAVCSPENLPLERYAARLLELYVGAPFSAGAIQRMSRKMLEQAKAWLDAHVSFLLPEEHSPTVAHLLDLAPPRSFAWASKVWPLIHGTNWITAEPPSISLRPSPRYGALRDSIRCTYGSWRTRRNRRTAMMATILYPPRTTLRARHIGGIKPIMS
jgi:twinkle protein